MRTPSKGASKSAERAPDLSVGESCSMAAERRPTTSSTDCHSSDPNGARFDTRHVEQIANQEIEPLGFLDKDLREFPAGRRSQCGVLVEERACRARHDGQWCS